MQVLETLAAVCAVFEQAGSDILHADGRAAMEEFNEDQHNQERTRGVLHDSRESLDNAFMEFKEACRGLEDAGKRVAETQRKAAAVSAEYGTAEGDFQGQDMRCHAVPLMEVRMRYGIYKKLWL